MRFSFTTYKNVCPGLASIAGVVVVACVVCVAVVVVHDAIVVAYAVAVCMPPWLLFSPPPPQCTLKGERLPN